MNRVNTVMRVTMVSSVHWTNFIVISVDTRLIVTKKFGLSSMSSTLRIASGALAKKTGHLNENKICEWLNENHSGTHVVDGGNKTKVDIINLDSQVSYSVKSVSKNHTQCHLTSSQRWCEYFNIDGKLKGWFMRFFGVPGIDVSEGKNRRHRLTYSDIDFELNDLAYQWFNDMKTGIFHVIIEAGMNDTPVDYLIWHQKKTNVISVHSIDSLRFLIKDGEWILNETTLHFISNEQKLFHLQMKGSGKKYSSSYHSLMFHIHKCF